MGRWPRGDQEAAGPLNAKSLKRCGPEHLFTQLLNILSLVYLKKTLQFAKKKFSPKMLKFFFFN